MRLTDEDVEEMIQEADSDGTGQVDKQTKCKKTVLHMALWKQLQTWLCIRNN